MTFTGKYFEIQSECLAVKGNGCTHEIRDMLFRAFTLKETLLLPSSAKSICSTFMDCDAICLWSIKLDI